jgi:hypothetical protein
MDARDQNDDPHFASQVLLMLGQRLNNLEQLVSEIHEIVIDERVEKEWYTTSEVAKLMNVAQYTVQERWCNQGRIECEKDPDTGKWRIPGHEYRRLKSGDGLLPKGR